MKNPLPVASLCLQSRRTWDVAACLAGIVLLCGTPAAAQPVPSVEQLIEQLRPTPALRSLGGSRNLAVSQTPAPVASNTVLSPPASGTLPEDTRPNVSLLIQFAFDSARIAPTSKPALLALARALQSPQLIDARFLVEGHTDARGSAAYNQRLSATRAEAVTHFLVAAGVAPSRLTAQGKGSSALARPEAPGAAENRRVRIITID